LNESAYTKLAAVNVNDKTEKKNGLTYLSWAWAVDQLLRHDAAATWEYKDPARFGDTLMVFCAVTAFGKTMTAQLPVMDHRNKAIPNPDAFQVNVAMALHGLGLYIYAGEDLPEGVESEMQALARQANALFSQGKVDEAVALVNSVTEAEPGLELWALIPAELKKASKALPAARAALVDKVHSAIVDHLSADDTAGAYEEYSQVTDSKEKAALWAKLGKVQKEQISAYGRSLKE
jgi:hypothetical protein